MMLTEPVCLVKTDGNFQYFEKYQGDYFYPEDWVLIAKHPDSKECTFVQGEPDGARSVLLRSEVFSRKSIRAYDKEVKFVKLKGPRFLNMPPISRLHGSWFGRVITVYEFDKDGNDYETVKDQPSGTTKRYILNDLQISHLLLKHGVPVNTLPIGMALYKNYNYKFQSGEEEPMGYVIFGILDKDRIGSLFLTLREDISDKIKEERILRLIDLAHSLDMRFDDFVNKKLYQEVVDILKKMHELGVVQGFPAANLRNFVLPSKEYHYTKICDFETSHITHNFTTKQIRAYRACDLTQVLTEFDWFYDQFNSTLKRLRTKVNKSEIGNIQHPFYTIFSRYSGVSNNEIKMFSDPKGDIFNIAFNIIDYTFPK